MIWRALFASTTALALLAAVCGPLPDDTDAGTPDAGGGVEPVCTEPKALACEDQLYLQLTYQTFASSGGVTTTEDNGVFTSTIDATAGGMGGSASNPFVYARFTESGLEKLDISDDEALSSMEWHLSARRFVILTNGGAAGPACVGVAAVDGDFDAVTAPPADGAFAEEAFYDGSCNYVADTRYDGFDGPDSILKEWWQFNDCVATSGQVFVLRLADGRHVKLVVDAYYASGQEDCNTMGLMGTGSANLTLRWAWL